MYLYHVSFSLSIYEPFSWYMAWSWTTLYTCTCIYISSNSSMNYSMLNETLNGISMATKLNFWFNITICTVWVSIIYQCKLEQADQKQHRKYHYCWNKNINSTLIKSTIQTRADRIVGQVWGEPSAYMAVLEIMNG